jgi:hypothetical protein
MIMDFKPGDPARIKNDDGPDDWGTVVDVRVEYPRLTETRNFEEHLSEYPLHVDIGRKIVAISRDQLDRVVSVPRTGNHHD